jgi:hypothetical protein
MFTWVGVEGGTFSSLSKSCHKTVDMYAKLVEEKKTGFES